jgi:hypothetical protein
LKTNGQRLVPRSSLFERPCFPKPLLQAFNQIVHQTEQAIVDDPECVITVNVSCRRRWPGWSSHAAALVPRQAPPGIVGILHLLVPLAVLAGSRPTGRARLSASSEPGLPWSAPGACAADELLACTRELAGSQAASNDQPCACQGERARDLDPPANVQPGPVAGVERRVPRASVHRFLAPDPATGMIGTLEASLPLSGGKEAGRRDQSTNGASSSPPRWVTFGSNRLISRVFDLFIKQAWLKNLGNRDIGCVFGTKLAI